MTIRYVNIPSPYGGVETVDQVDSADFRTHAEFKAELREVMACYRAMYMDVWLSNRATKEWRER